MPIIHFDKGSILAIEYRVKYWSLPSPSALHTQSCKGVEQQTTAEEENIFFSLGNATGRKESNRKWENDGIFYLPSFVCKLEKYLHGEDDKD